jgi:VCBS repeat-containing protein
VPKTKEVFLLPTLSRFRRGAAILAAAALLAVPAHAADAAVRCLSHADFSGAVSLDGIVVTAVPGDAALTYGTRVLRAGDILPAAALDGLTLSGAADGDADISYLPVSGGVVGTQTTLSLHLGSSKNEAPTATDQQFETYKNIPLTESLTASDPENGTLTYAVVTEPKHGTVTLSDDGTFTYTPKKNKVGKDSFTYTATDDQGQAAQATVSITIQKPADKATFTDMAGDPDQFVAMWLKEQGVYGGETLAGNLYFNPDETVTRGEFLVMVMDLLDISPETDELVSGFADESDTPSWMRPYIVSALRSGIVAGVHSADGLVFRPTAELTHAEAAVMVNNILGLEGDSAVSVFAADDDVPTWARSAVEALSQADILSTGGDTTPMTRRECARLLYAAWQQAGSGEASLLSWAAE